MVEVNRDDLARIRQVLLHWLGDRLPDAKAIEVPSLTSPEEGGSSQTLFVDAIIDRGGERRPASWVLRIEATGHQIYRDPSVEPQYLIMKHLADSGDVPVPEVLWYESDPDILGAPFFLMERVEGSVPTAFYHSEGLFAEASVDQREALWLSAVEAMAAIHRTETEGLGFLDRPERGATGLDQEIALWDAYRDWCGAPMTPAQERARLWLEDHRPGHRPTGLAWGDARLPNMVFRDNRCRAVIDWETASLGGAETDLGWWLFFDWYVSDGIGIPRLPGLPGPETFIETWEDLMGRRARDLLWHEVFATWRFSMISARARLLAGRELPSGEGDDPLSRRLRELT